MRGVRSQDFKANMKVFLKNSEDRRIRTPGTPKGTTDFESAPFDHSGSSPDFI